MPAISILMPAWNGLPYIREAVASVFAQDMEDWELLISDNGSTDGTREYLATLDDPRIRVVMQERNLGIFGNLNFLFREARNSICKVLCADDWLLPACLRTHVTYFAAHPEVGIVRCWEVGDSSTFGAGGFARLQGQIAEILPPAAALLAFATFGNLLGNLTTAACRREVVLESGGFDQRLPYAGDFEGWVRMTTAATFGHLREELVTVRKHAMQQSNLLNKKNELASEVNSILITLLTRIPARLHPLIRWHWSYHFIAPRWSGSLRLLRKGQVSDALKIWLPPRVPPGGSLLPTLLYPLWKMRSPVGDISTRRLVREIQALAIPQ